MEKKKEVKGIICFEQKSIGKKRAEGDDGFHWLSSWGRQFLIGNAVHAFSCWGLILMILSCDESAIEACN